MTPLGKTAGGFPAEQLWEKKKQRKYEACLGKSYSIISFLDCYPVMVNQIVGKKNKALGTKIKSSYCMT